MTCDAETSMTLQLLDKDNDDNDSHVNTVHLDLSYSNSSDNLVISEGSSSSGNPSLQKKCSTMAQTLVSYGLRQIETPEENFSLNPNLAFFMSLMPDVRAMTEQQKKKFRKEIVNTMDNILYGEHLTHLTEDTDKTVDNSAMQKQPLTHKMK